MVLMFTIFFLVFAPIFILLLTFRFRAQDLLNLNNITKTNPFVSNPVDALSELKKNLEKQVSSNKKATNPTSKNFSDPYLHFKLNIEGRDHDQSTRVFIGIAQGNQVVTSPIYILSFLVDIPATGEYSGISITGIDIGAPYTAYVKGAAQLTKAVSFTSGPALNDLGTVNLITGDLNEDNMIDGNDLSLLKKLFGSTPSSPNWNQYYDFNSDGIINNIDFSYITRNTGKVGDSGPWVSSPLKNAVPATSSGTLGVSISPPDATPSGEGYWLWIPRY